LHVSLLRRLWVTFSAYVVGTYASCINNFRVKGWENIPESGGVLLASNHISAYETIFLPWAVIKYFPMQMLWAPAKEELFRKPFTRWVYTSWGAFPVNRRLNELLLDQKVMLFPEGTRHGDGVLGKGNRGVGKIIYDTRPVVIPTALVGLNRWEFPSKGMDGLVLFGQQIDFSDLFLLEDNKSTHQMIVDRVMDNIAGLLRREGAYVNES
jgi:1-acyl-sn-glycerol-3-phosphate acyltransferase